MSRLSEQLKKTAQDSRLHPRDVWVKEQRQILLSHIKNESQSVATEHTTTMIDFIEKVCHIFVPQKMQMAFRPLMVVLAILVIGTSGWIASVSAFSNSLPTDSFGWNVKLATEQAQIAVSKLSGNDVHTTHLYMEFADRRANEIQQVLHKKTRQADAAAQLAMNQLKQNIKSANQSVQDVIKKNPQQVTAVVDDIHTQTQHIAKTLQLTVEHVDQTNSSISKQVVDTTNLVNASTLNALQTVLTGLNAQQISTSTIASILMQKIDVMRSTVESVSSTVADITAYVGTDGADMTVVGFLNAKTTSTVQTTSSSLDTSSSVQSINSSTPATTLTSTTVSTTIQQTATTTVVTTTAMAVTSSVVKIYIATSSIASSTTSTSSTASTVKEKKVATTTAKAPSIVDIIGSATSIVSSTNTGIADIQSLIKQGKWKDAVIKTETILNILNKKQDTIMRTATTLQIHVGVEKPVLVSPVTNTTTTPKRVSTSTLEHNITSSTALPQKKSSSTTSTPEHNNTTEKKI